MRLHQLICSALVVLALQFAADARADDWNAGTGGKPSRTSLSIERGPLAPDTLWHGGLTAVIAQPPVIEGNILAMSRIQNLNDVLHGTLIVAHDLMTGDTLWTADLPVDFPSTDWRNRVSAIRDGRVYATRSGNDNYSFLYALNADNGEVLWRSQDSVNESSTESASFAPNGDLIVGSFRNVERIDATNGNRVWRSNRVSPTSNGNEAAVFNDRLYLWEASPQGPKVTSFDLLTGALRFSSFGIGGGFVQQLGLFVGPNGTVYAPRTQNNASTDFLVALEDHDSTFVERWRLPLGYAPFASFGIGPDGSVYSYTAEHRLIRIAAATGEIMDSSDVVETDFFQPRIAIDTTGIVYLTNGGFSQGALYSFNPDLSLRWTISVPGVNIGGPAIGPNGTLVVCGTGTNVLAFLGVPSGIDTERQLFVVGIPVLNQNYPNPFNQSTVISYDLPGSMAVKLVIFNMIGQKVATIVDGFGQAGHQTQQFDASGLASGRYFCRLQAGEYQQIREMILLK